MDEPKETDRLTELSKQTKEVKGVMARNIDLVMQRGEKLDQMDERAESLSQASSQFKTTSKKLEKKLWWKNFKLWLILVIILISLLGVIVLIVVIAVLTSKNK